MFEHHPATVRLAGRKRRTQDLRASRLAKQPAVARALPWSCTSAALRYTDYRVSLAEALHERDRFRVRVELNRPTPCVL